MKQKIKKLISFLEDNQLELERLVFNKGKLSFQVSNKLYEMVITATSGINQDDRYKWYQEEKAKLKDSPITQEQVNKVINSVVKDEWVFNPFDYGFEEGEIEDGDNNFIAFIKYPDISNHRVYFIIKERYFNGTKCFDFRKVEPMKHHATHTFIKQNDKEYIESVLKRFGVIEEKKEIPYVFVPTYFNFEYNDALESFKKTNNKDETFLMYQNKKDFKWVYKKFRKSDGVLITFINNLEFKTFKDAEAFLFRNGVIEKTQTTFDGEKQINIEDEKITDYKFCPLKFFGFRYNERGYFIKERKDEGDKITSTFIMYPSNRESNSKTRWTFKRYNDKGIEITFYGDLTFKSYEEVEQFFFRNGVIKCD